MFKYLVTKADGSQRHVFAEMMIWHPNGFVSFTRSEGEDLELVEIDVALYWCPIEVVDITTDKSGEENS